MINENPRQWDGTGLVNHRPDDVETVNKLQLESQAPDDIRTFLPGICEDEYRLRAKLRSMRNCAAAMIVKTESNTARALAWLCSDYSTAHVYAGVSNDRLIEVHRLCHRLMVTAMQAEALDGGNT